MKWQRLLKVKPALWTLAGGAVGFAVYLLYAGLGST